MYWSDWAKSIILYFHLLLLCCCCCCYCYCYYSEFLALVFKLPAFSASSVLNYMSVVIFIIVVHWDMSFLPHVTCHHQQLFLYLDTCNSFLRLYVSHMYWKSCHSNIMMEIKLLCRQFYYFWMSVILDPELFHRCHCFFVWKVAFRNCNSKVDRSSVMSKNTHTFVQIHVCVYTVFIKIFKLTTFLVSKFVSLIGK
jgi:hypothetical protein